MSKNGLNELYRDVRRLDEKVKPTLRARLISGYRLLVEARLRMALPKDVTPGWVQAEDRQVPGPEFRELNVVQQFSLTGVAAEDPEARRSFLTRVLDVVDHKKNQAIVDQLYEEEDEPQEPEPEPEDDPKSDSPVWGTFSDLVRETKNE